MSAPVNRGAVAVAVASGGEYNLFSLAFAEQSATGWSLVNTVPLCQSLCMPAQVT